MAKAIPPNNYKYKKKKKRIPGTREFKLSNGILFSP
jgi:hypothetical protein